MKVIDCTDAAWNQYLSRMPQNKRDVYFTAEYHDAYERNGDGKPQLFIFESHGELGLYPFLINTVPDCGFSRQYYDIQSVYGFSGPLSTTDDPGFLRCFEETFLDYARNVGIVAEFIRFHPLLANHDSFSNSIEISADRQTVVLNMQNDLEHMLTYQISPLGRRNIRIAERRKLHATVSSNWRLFKKLYTKTMQELGANDYYFFSDPYFNSITGMDSTFIIEILKDDIVIASGLFIFSSDYCHYHLGCSDKSFLSYRPVNLLLWEAIKNAKQRECRYFHFGGGRTTCPDDSLLSFKANFSKDRAVFYIGKRVHKPEIYNALIGEWEQKHSKPATMLLEYRNNSKGR